MIKELEAKYARKEAIGQYLAAVYGELGDKDKAFEWLEKDCQTRNGKLAEIRWQIQFEPFATIRDTRIWSNGSVYRNSHETMP